MKILIQKAHDLLGRINKYVVKSTAQQLGWELTKGTLGVYEACTLAKAKQKNLPRHQAKTTDDKATG
jgi:hypothetical protein